MEALFNPNTNLSTPLSGGKRRRHRMRGGEAVAAVVPVELSGGKRRRHYRMGGGEAAVAPVADVAPVELSGGKKHRRRHVRGGEAAVVPAVPVELSGGRRYRMHGGEQADAIEGGKKCNKGSHRSRTGVCRKHHKINSKGHFVKRSPKACTGSKTRNPDTGRCHTPKGK